MNDEQDQRKKKLKEYGLMLATGTAMSVGAGISSWLVKIQTDVLQEEIGWKEALLKGYLDEYLYMNYPEAMIGFAMVVGFLGGVLMIWSHRGDMNL